MSGEAYDMVGGPAPVDLNPEARLVPLVDGSTAIAPEGIRAAMVHYLKRATYRDIDRHVDRLVRHLHAYGLVVVPLTFDRTSTAAVALNIYTQALAWKHDAERRAAAAERELAELQALFVDPPHALLPGGFAGEVSPSSATEGSEAAVMGLMTPPSAMSGHLPAGDGREES